MTLGASSVLMTGFWLRHATNRCCCRRLNDWVEESSKGKAVVVAVVDTEKQHKQAMEGPGRCFACPRWTPDQICANFVVEESECF